MCSVQEDFQLTVSVNIINGLRYLFTWLFALRSGGITIQSEETKPDDSVSNLTLFTILKLFIC